jgi:hypothetical protein
MEEARAERVSCNGPWRRVDNKDASGRSYVFFYSLTTGRLVLA